MKYYTKLTSKDFFVSDILVDDRFRSMENWTRTITEINTSLNLLPGISNGVDIKYIQSWDYVTLFSQSEIQGESK